MSIWSQKRASIQELADELARGHHESISDEWRQKILGAIWLGELPIVHCYNGDRDQLFTPFGRDELRVAVSAFGELKFGRKFMGQPVLPTSRILPSALPFATLAKLPWSAYAADFRDVYLDRLLVETLAVGQWRNNKFEARIGGRPRKPEKAAELKERLEKALAYAETMPRKEYAWIARQAIEQKKNYDFDSEALRKIYAGQYPAMKRFGLKGIHG